MSKENDAKAQDFLEKKKAETKERVRKGQDKASKGPGAKVQPKGQSTSEPRFRAN